MPKRPMRITHRFLSFRCFVGLLTHLFRRRGFSPLRKRIASAFSRSHDSSSNDRFSPRARFALHGKQYFRNTATLGSLPRCLLTAEAASFRVRDSHPIPLFSEQECVSDCSGRAFATKAMLFSLLYVHLILRTQKDLSCPAISQAKEVSYSLDIRFDCTQKLPLYLNRKGWVGGWLVGWWVGCKNCANYLHFYNYLPCLRTFPFQNLHPYLTAIRGDCKV